MCYSYVTFHTIPLLNPVPKCVLHCSLRSDLPVLEKEVTDGAILPDIITPESQTLQLTVPEESSQYAVSTIGDVLTVSQVVCSRGIALAVAVAVLLAGIGIRVFSDRG